MSKGLLRVRSWRQGRFRNSRIPLFALAATFAVALMADVAIVSTAEAQALSGIRPSLTGAGPLGSLRVLDDQGLPAAGAAVQLWKDEPNVGGFLQPIEIASAVTDNQGSVNLIDPTLYGGAPQAGAAPNYLVTTEYQLGTSDAQASEFAWTDSEAQPHNLTLTTQPFPAGSVAALGASSGMMPARDAPFCIGQTYVEQTQDTLTDIGEEHSTISSEQTQFTYGDSAGSSLTVYGNANGGGWSVSGSVTISSGNTQSTSWPYLTNDTGWVVKSKFAYTWFETNWNTNNPMGCTPPPMGTYPWTVEATQFLAGSYYGNEVIGYNNACPNWVTGGVEGLYTTFQGGPGSSYTYSESNGAQYSAAASATFAGVQFGFTDTTQYNTHESENFVWPDSGVTYYVYTGPANTNWPAETAYLTTSAISCGGGGGCVYVNTPILLVGGRYEAVQDLRLGQMLQGYNVVTGDLTRVALTGLNESTANTLVSVNDGALLLTSTDQPIFIQNSTYLGWLQNPDQLVPGDALFQPSTHTWIIVTSVTTEHGSFPDYEVNTSGPNDFIANGYLLDRKA